MTDLRFLVNSLHYLSLLEGLVMGVVSPEVAQKLLDAIATERQQYQQKIDEVIQSTLASAKAEADAAGAAEVATFIDSAIEDLSSIVPDEPAVNAEPDEPSETPVDEAATELMEEVET